MNEKNKLYVKVTRKIHGPRPTISFESLRYSSPSLYRDTGFIGKVVEVSVDPEDIRTLDVKIKGGKSLGKVEILPSDLLSQKISLDDYRQLRLTARNELLRRQNISDSDDIYLAIMTQNKNITPKRPNRDFRKPLLED